MIPRFLCWSSTAASPDRPQPMPGRSPWLWCQVAAFRRRELSPRPGACQQLHLNLAPKSESRRNRARRTSRRSSRSAYPPRRRIPSAVCCNLDCWEVSSTTRGSSARVEATDLILLESGDGVAQPSLLEPIDEEAMVVVCARCGAALLDVDPWAYDAWDRPVHEECLPWGPAPARHRPIRKAA